MKLACILCEVVFHHPVKLDWSDDIQHVAHFIGFIICIIPRIFPSYTGSARGVWVRHFIALFGYVGTAATST